MTATPTTIISISAADKASRAPEFVRCMLEGTGDVQSPSRAAVFKFENAETVTSPLSLRVLRCAIALSIEPVLHEGSDDATKTMFEFLCWWLRKDKLTLDKTLPKVAEYSSADLEIMGEAMLKMLQEPKIHGMELAIAFYVLGKISRIIGSIRDDRTPNIDSWLDNEVYSRMAQRVRESGTWP